MKRVAHHTARWTLSLVFLTLVVIAIVTGAARISLPFVGAYRVDIQDYLSQYLGNPVEIGSLELSWRGFGPRLVLEDVILVSGAEQAQDVHLHKILLDVNLLSSWMQESWQINEMSIVGANLSVEYLGNNKYRVYGRQIDGASNNEATNLDVLGWLMQADMVALLESRVRFIYRQKSIDLEARELNIRAQNNSGLHRIRIDAAIPALSPDVLNVAMDFSGDRQQLLDSNGSFTAALSGADLQALSGLLPSLAPVSVSGSAGLELFGKWSDESLQHLRVISRLSAFEVANKTTLKRWSSAGVDTDLVMQKEGDKYRLGIQEFTLGSAPRGQMLRGNLLLDNTAADAWRANLSGPRLVLQSFMPVVNLFEGIDGAEQFVETFQKLEPTGELQDWRLSVDKSAGQFPKISAQAELNKITFKPVGKFPGFSDFNGQLRLRENLGELAIAEGAFSLDFPIWFRAPLQIDRAQGGIGFRFSAEKFEMQSPSLSLANAHVRGESQFYVHKTPGNPAFLDIQAHIDQADASFAHLYYPAERMNPKLVAWLDEAIRAGRLSNGRLQVRGPSKGFPYADGQGDFTASFEIENGRLGFLSDWPEIDAIKARVEFERNSMTVEASDGVSAGNRLSSAHITIDDFKNPVLKIHSGIAGEAADFISYIDRSPLQKILEPVIGDSSMQGALALDLGLEIPLKGDIRKQLAIDGKLDLKKTRWQSKRFGFDLQAIEGPLEFTEKTLTTPGITADYLRQPILVTAAVDKNQPAMFSRISVKGDIDAHEVLKNYKLPIGQWFSGLAPWELTLTARRTPDETNAMQLALLARSRLVGTTVDLPAPYGKPAAMPWPVSVRAEFSGEQQDRFWRFDYGRKITGKARIADGAMDALLIGFNEMLPPDTEMQPGITVSGRVPELSFDGWVSSIAGVIAAMPAAESPGKLMPVTSSLEVDSLKVGKIDAGPARFSGDTTDEYLATRMDSKWLSGNLYYPRDLSDKGKPLKAELALLDKQFLDALTTADGEGGGERIDPRAFPAMDIGVGRFIWDEYQIADMNVRTVPVADGMKTEALGFVHDDLQMFGEAHWRMQDPQQVTSDLASAHRTDVRFRLQSADVGKGLAYIGIGGAFADGEGEVEVELGWDDAAYAPALDEINGTIAIELNKGRILAVEPGAAKILGLFALQAVPRRLLLDFKDVTDEGLLYDNIKGEIDIAHGIAETRLMQLKGPIGIVSSSGSTDFVSGTYDQKISVLPSLTATLPIIGLISAGATAGVGVLVADQVLKGLGVNFDEVGKREYLLSGSWENPLIERIDAPMQGVPQPDNR